MDDEIRTSGESDLPERELEDGLRLAFGGEGARAGESAIQALERLTGIRSRILLPDAEDDESPVVKVRTDGEEEPMEDPRYQVLGEIARGGVGVVFKSRDRDLGRDVAIKVLRSDLADVPEVVQRFIEEAQIGGQLQHPGIVPVYGLGIQKDGRPYFAMKLVKGRTLSVLLRETEGRGRLLAMFERICQTVAYAHARRVVHRDLKPSNVLVGAYGEVQVVDWGFAKVLPQGGTADERSPGTPGPDLSVIETIRTKDVGSTSQVGSVMGTPAYMPPEQARGEVEKLDERADVFALGAILCEILTRKPPYTGKGNKLLSKAASASLDEAMARLDACGADPELIELTRLCLAPAPAARPRHAGEVAEAVSAHLASVEERRRQAELRAAAARRTRTLTIALAAAVLLAVVLGGGGFWAADRSRRDRREQATAAVSDALREASLVLGRARSAGVEETDPWDEALGAADDAVGIAEKVGAPEAATGEAEAFRARVSGERDTALAAAARALADRELAARLGEIGLGWSAAYKIEDKEERYHDTFAGVGLDPDRTEPAALAVRIGASGIRDGLVDALDDWLRVRQAEDEEAGPLRAHLARVDPDPFRERVRDLTGAMDRDGLRKLREETDLRAIPLPSLRRLGEALGTVGDPTAAIEVLRVARDRNPPDLRTCAALGSWLMTVEPPRPQEASACFARIVAASPESPRGHAWLAESYRRSGLLDAGLSELREVHRLAPEVDHIREVLCWIVRAVGHGRWKLRHHAAAAELYREAVALDDSHALSWANLAANLQNVPGGMEEADRASRRAVELAPDEPVCQGIRGEVARRLGKWDEALAAFERCGSTIWCAVVLGECGRPEEAVHYYREVLESQPRSTSALGGLAATLYLLDRVDEAIDVMETLRRVKPASDLLCHLSRAYRRKGDHERARTFLERAIDLACGESAAVGEWLGQVVGCRYGRAEATAWLESRFPRASREERASFQIGLACACFYNSASPDEAERCLDEGLRLAPEAPRGHWFRAQFASARGDDEAALPSLRRAFELEKSKLSAHWPLALGLSVTLRFEEALPLLRRCSEAKGTSHVSTVLAWTEELAALYPRLPDLLAGRIEPADTREAFRFATLCGWSGHHRKCIELIERVLEAGIEWNEEDPIYDLEDERRSCDLGATSAARAARGEDGDAGSLGPEERRALWAKARTFLARRLVVERRLLRYQTIENKQDPRRQLAPLKLHPLFAPFRDPERLAKLPPEVRTAWEALWRELDEMFERWRY